ncbi:hypothetical protein, partial [Ensifer sp. Root31]|uniref:hypothetical protein n=1 Tax=Ensifer sp. Root31 TaxID=1736512 RepID=UPI001AEC9CA7
RRNSRPDQSASANQGNLKTKDIVASSAAALVSDRAYRPHPSHTSTGNRKKSTRSNNTLKIHTKFKRELSTARSASPNQQNQNQNHSPIGRKALPRARETPSLTLTSP